MEVIKVVAGVGYAAFARQPAVLIVGIALAIAAVAGGAGRGQPVENVICEALCQGQVCLVGDAGDIPHPVVAVLQEEERLHRVQVAGAQPVQPPTLAPIRGSKCRDPTSSPKMLFVSTDYHSSLSFHELWA